MEWLVEPLNVNSRPNSDILRPISSGGDITKGRRLNWVIDFSDVSEEQASHYEKPFSFILDNVRSKRLENKRALYAKNWWRFSEARPGLRRGVEPLKRFIAKAKIARFRPFVWLEKSVIPDNLIIAICRDDDTSLGLLSSSFHAEWATRSGGSTGVGNDPSYTPTTTFETFPFPEGLTPDIPAAAYAADPRAARIAAAAVDLDRLRRNWLHPADLGEWQPEITPTAAPGEAPRRYPDRFVPKNVEAAAKLKERTLTKLYNQRPAWLTAAHGTLDRAVAAAYGWPEDIATDDALAKLLALNLERAAAGR